MTRTEGEMVRGGAEAHRSSGLTTEGTPETRDRAAGSFPGAIGRPMIRHVLRDNEARAGRHVSGNLFHIKTGAVDAPV